MNHAPGRVNANNSLIPFAQFDTLHFARLLILDDKTVDDIRVYDLTPVTYPLYLAFLGDFDGERDTFLEDWRSSRQLGCALFFPAAKDSACTDLLTWMKEHSKSFVREYRTGQDGRSAAFGKRRRCMKHSKATSRTMYPLSRVCRRARFTRS